MASLTLAFAVSLAWCGLAIYLGPRIGYVDHPDDPALKAHDRPAVPLGGVGVFLGVHLAALARGEVEPALLAATVIVLVLGLVDDRRGLSPGVRLGVELMAAIALVLVGPGPGGGMLAVILAVALAVFAVNAVNLFDGLDGLAGSVGVVTALGIAWLAAGRGLEAAIPVELAAALVGFLVLGWHPARVFLGDAGAYVLGMTIAYAIVYSSPDGLLQLTVGAGVIGIFAVDLLAAMVRRRLSGHPMFLGDRSHLYDQLRDRGWSVPGVALAMSAAQAAVVSIVIFADRTLRPWAAVGVVAMIQIGSLALLWSLGFLRPHARQAGDSP